MVVESRYKCIVCGRVFPEGQGVIVSRGGLTLTFHSGRCAYKFFKLWFERVDLQCLAIARDIMREYEKIIDARKPVKKI
ncbi:MAG: hypothetical protein QXR02_05170 [Acidilobaceae archaeon]